MRSADQAHLACRTLCNLQVRSELLSKTREIPPDMVEVRSSSRLAASRCLGCTCNEWLLLRSPCISTSAAQAIYQRCYVEAIAARA